MNLLITGGAGFIGSNFTYFMIEKYSDINIVVLDALTYAGNIQTIKPLMGRDNFSFIKGDITNRDFVDYIFSEYKIDTVINFAAESHVDRSIENPEIFLKTNILGTQVLMDLCLRYEITRFHQVSTDEVYGDLPLDRPDILFKEDSLINTSSPYSASKASADLLVQSYIRTFNLPGTISRCSNNYGPYHFPEKLIPLMIRRAIRNQSLPVYGSGENVRDWIHVYDHCTALDLILHKGVVGEVYNIGGNNERSNLEVVKSIILYLEKSEELIEFVEDRKGHDLRYAIDSTKIRRELGWRPIFDFDKGLVETIDWFIKNQEWVENIINGEYLRFMKYHYN